VEETEAQILAKEEERKEYEAAANRAAEVKGVER
jgi:hypothetical protein